MVVPWQREHRPSDSKDPQRQGAELPLAIFREFISEVLRRYQNHSDGYKRR